MIHSTSRKSGYPPDPDAPTSRNRSRSPSTRRIAATSGSPAVRAAPGTVTVGPTPDQTQAERDNDAGGDTEGDATLRPEHRNADSQADQDADRPGPDSRPDALRARFRHASILFGAARALPYRTRLPAGRRTVRQALTRHDPLDPPPDPCAPLSAGIPARLDCLFVHPSLSTGWLRATRAGVGREHGSDVVLVGQRTTPADSLSHSLGRRPINGFKTVHVSIVVDKTHDERWIEGPASAAVIPEDRVACAYVHDEEPGWSSDPLVIPVDHVIRQQSLSPTW